MVYNIIYRRSTQNKSRSLCWTGKEQNNRYTNFERLAGRSNVYLWTTCIQNILHIKQPEWSLKKNP